MRTRWLRATGAWTARCNKEAGRNRWRTEYFIALSSSVSALPSGKEGKERAPNKVRDRSWFQDGFGQWNDQLLKEHFRVKRETFQLILSCIADDIRKEPIVMKPSLECQLEITLYPRVYQAFVFGVANGEFRRGYLRLLLKIRRSHRFISHIFNNIDNFQVLNSRSPR